MQWGVGHGALRPFSWRFRILSHYSLICLKFKYVHEKAFSQSFHLQQRLIKQSVWYFTLFFFLVGNLNWFEKVAVSNVHLVPAAQDHDTFHQSKNRSVRQTLLVKYHTTWITYPSYQTLHSYVKTANPTSQKLIFCANTNLTAMRCSVTSHFGGNFRDKISTFVFDF